MKFNFPNKLGFTLVELLVVIAIIGILSSVAVVNLNSARDKARVTSIKETLASLRPIIILCFSNDENIQGEGPPIDCVGAEQPQAGQKLCNSMDQTWPLLEDIVAGWDYVGSCNSDYTNGAYYYQAKENGGDGPATVTCSNDAGCIST